MPALISSLAVNVFDHSQRHGAVLSRRESVRPRQIRFFLSEETPPALSGPAHSFSCNPDTRDETLRHLAAFSQATVFCPHSLPDTPHFSFGGMTTTALLGSAHSLSRTPGACNKRSGTLRNFLKQPFFYPHSLPDTPHFSFGGMTTTALLGSAHSLSRTPGACNKRSGTLRHFLKQPFFCPAFFA